MSVDGVRGYINIKLKDEPKTLRVIISKISHRINNNWLSTIEFFNTKMLQIETNQNFFIKYF